MKRQWGRLVSLLLTLNIFHTLFRCPSVSIVNFEQVDGGWADNNMVSYWWFITPINNALTSAIEITSHTENHAQCYSNH